MASESKEEISGRERCRSGKQEENGIVEVKQKPCSHPTIKEKKKSKSRMSQKREGRKKDDVEPCGRPKK
jgi:hypothetical protein